MISGLGVWLTLTTLTWAPYSCDREGRSEGSKQDGWEQARRAGRVQGLLLGTHEVGTEPCRASPRRLDRCDAPQHEMYPRHQSACLGMGRVV
jgi:hypothetical protein